MRDDVCATKRFVCVGKGCVFGVKVWGQGAGLAGRELGRAERLAVHRSQQPPHVHASRATSSALAGCTATWELRRHLDVLLDLLAPDLWTCSSLSTGSSPCSPPPSGRTWRSTVSALRSAATSRSAASMSSPPRSASSSAASSRAFTRRAWRPRPGAQRPSARPRAGSSTGSRSTACARASRRRRTTSRSAPSCSRGCTACTRGGSTRSAGTATRGTWCASCSRAPCPRAPSSTSWCATLGPARLWCGRARRAAR